MKKILKTLFFLILAAVGIGLIGFTFLITYLNPPDTEQYGDRKEDFYTFVLCGTDEGDYRTDTIIVGALDLKNNSVELVSVPRDTMIDVSWNVKKINSAYSVGGIDRLKTELKKILGFTVDFYAVIDMEAFVQIVDTIGGVEFDVPTRMYKEDPWISLYPGVQTLSGEQALQFVRYRDYPMGDIERIAAQQSFLKATFSQAFRLKNIFKIKSLVDILKENMSTDLTAENMVWLGIQLLRVDSGNIHFHTLPGNSSAYYGGLSYHCLYPNQVAAMVNETVNPYKRSIQTGDLDILTM